MNNDFDPSTAVAEKDDFDPTTAVAEKDDFDPSTATPVKSGAFSGLMKLDTEIATGLAPVVAPVVGLATSAGKQLAASLRQRREATYTPILQQAEQKHGLEPGLLVNMARQESRFNPEAKNPKGAAGLMQFMPETAKEYGINPLDPAQSAEAAGRKMAHLKQYYKGDTDKAVAAYNWGEGNLDRAIKAHGGDWRSGLPAETANYLATIRGEAKAVEPIKPDTGSVVSGIAQSVPGAFKQINLAAKLALADLFHDGSAEDEAHRNDLLRKAENLQIEQEAKDPQFETATGRGLYGGAQSLAQNSVGLVASILTGNPAPALALAGIQSGLPAYSKYRTRGGKPGESALGAGAEGAIEIGTELIPMGYMVKQMGKAGLGQFLTGLLAREMPTEQVATITQDAVDTAIANPEKTWGQFWEERPDAAYQTALGVLVQTGALTAVNSGAKLIGGNREQDTRNGTDVETAVDVANKPAGGGVIPVEPTGSGGFSNLSGNELTRNARQEPTPATPLQPPFPDDTIAGRAGLVLAPVEAKRQPRERDKPIKPIEAGDSLLAAIAKLGGLDAQEAEAQGIDSPYIKGRSAAKGHGILKVFTGTGRSFDKMAETLREYGYQTEGANHLLGLVSDALGHRDQGGIDDLDKLAADQADTAQQMAEQGYTSPAFEFDETDYTPEMEEKGRRIYELVHQLESQQPGEGEALAERMAIQGHSDDDIIQALEQATHSQGNLGSPSQIPAGQSQRPQTETPQTADLYGQDGPIAKADAAKLANKPEGWAEAEEKARQGWNKKGAQRRLRLLKTWNVAGNDNHLRSFDALPESFRDDLTVNELEAKAFALKKAETPEQDYRASFAGEKAQTADKEALDKAQAMEREGKPAKEIWTATGWFRAPWDGKWRFEINDEWAGFNELPSENIANRMSLDRAVWHPDLYAAYPDIRLIQYQPKEGKGGHFSTEGGGLIVVGAKDSDLAPGGEGVTLHEIQHAIQRREGTATGGEARQMAVDFSKAMQDWEFYSDAKMVLDEALKNHGGNLDRALKEIQAAGFDEIGQEHVDEIMRLGEKRLLKKEEKTRKSFFDLKDKLKNSYGDTGIELYRRLAGEAEARLVQARMLLDAEQRREQFPLDSLRDMLKREGIDPGDNFENLITRFDSDRAMSEPATPQPSGQTVEAVKRKLGAKGRALRAAGLLEVVQSVKDLPITTSKAVRGIYTNGKAYLVADHIPEGYELGVALHEAGEHAAMADMLGPELYQKLDAEAQRLYAEGGDVAAAAFKAMPSNTTEKHKASERIAYLIEYATHADEATRRTLPGKLRVLVHRAIAALRAWFWRSNFGQALAAKGITLELTPRDLAALARAAVDYQLQQGATGKQRLQVAGARLSGAAMGGDNWIEEVRDDQGRLLASNGKPSNKMGGYTAKDWREWSKLPEFQDDDESTVLFNGGDSGYIKEVENRATGFFNGLFASRYIERANSHGSGDITAFRIPDDKLLTQDELDGLDYEKLKKAFLAVWPTEIDEDSDEFETAWKAVVDDKHNRVADDFMQYFENLKDVDDYDGSWFAQDIRGRFAKKLGYQAIEMKDEHGTSYFIVPGVKSIPLPESPSDDPDIRYSLDDGAMPKLEKNLKAMTVTDVKTLSGAAVKGLRSVGLGLLGRRHIVDLYGDEVTSLREYDKLIQEYGADSNELQHKAGELARDWAKLGPEVSDKLADVMHLSTVTGVDLSAHEFKAEWTEETARTAYKEELAAARKEKDRLKKLIAGSPGSPKKQWYDQLKVAWDNLNKLSKVWSEKQYIRRKLKADKEKATAFKQLKPQYEALPENAKAIYNQAKEMYQQQWTDVEEALAERIQRSNASDEQKAKNIASLRLMFRKELPTIYFPLFRTGDYILIVKKPDNTNEAVIFAESLVQAELLKKQLEKDYQGTDKKVMPIQKKAERATQAMVSGQFVSKVLDVLGTQDGSPQLEALREQVMQLYLEALPDLSWAKHEIHRKLRKGYSRDARRAFAANMMHGAAHLSRIRYLDRLESALDDMQKEVDQSRYNEGFDAVRAQEVVNEMRKRHAITMNPPNTPWANFATGLGFYFHMGLSPASAIVNMLQTPIVAYPVIGGQFGYDKAALALNVAAKDVALTLAGGGNLSEGADLIAKGAWAEGVKKGTGLLKTEKNLMLRLANHTKPDELDAIKRGIMEGHITVTLAHELAGVAQGSETHPAAKPIMEAASYMFHVAEMFNRMATLLAAYRLAKADKYNTEAAYQKAVELTYAGHFDYSANNRARFMAGPMARVILLFKQYAANMTYTYAKNGAEALAASKDFMTGQPIAEKRKVAARTFAGLITMQALAAGALGLPGVTTLLAAASWLWGDEDEPYDAETALRYWLAHVAGEGWAEAFLHGAPRGLRQIPVVRDTPLGRADIANRVGLDHLWFPDVQEGLEGDKWYQAMAMAALGPVPGIGLNIAKGLQEIAEGDTERGLEAILPKFAKDALKAHRYNQEGVKDKTGVTILDNTTLAEEISQALGFSPARVLEAYESRGAVYNQDKRLTKRREELLDKWSDATLKKDDAKRAEIKAEIDKFNRANPTQAIRGDGLLRSLMGKRKRIAQAKDGVYLPPKKAGLRDLGDFTDLSE